MPRYIIGHDGWYFEWSTIVDAPVTRGMRRDAFEEYYWEEYGNEGLREFPRRMARVDEKGTSALNYDSAEDTIICNRAGFKEAELSLVDIVRIYCVEQRGPREGEGFERADEDTE